MSEIKQLKRFIYSATVTSGSGSQSFYIDAESREEADERAANNESDGMYADDSEVTDLDALEYEDETTVDDFGDFPLISREQSLIAQLEATQKERDELITRQSKNGVSRLQSELIQSRINSAEFKQRAEKAEAELSVANEKLSKPVVLPELKEAVEFYLQVRKENPPIELGVHKDADEWLKRTAIKAAGFTVEGNADAE